MHWAITRCAFFGVGVAVVGAGVLACSSSGTQAVNQFARVDAAVSQIAPQTLGTVACDVKFGGTGISGDAPTRRVCVIADADIVSKVGVALTQAGFAASGATLWEKGSAETYMQVAYSTYAAGAALPVGAQPATVPEGRQAVSLSVSGGK